MAEKKVLTAVEKNKILDQMSEAINKKYGRTICGRISNSPELQEQLKIKYIPFPSPNLNKSIGGGLPRKKITILSGQEASGKTGTLLELIAKQQKNPDFYALWLESEDSFDPEFAKMLGVDLSRFHIIMYDKDRGAEATLDELISILEAGKEIFDIVVVNSLKCLTPKAELENSLTKDTIALQARFNSKMMRKLNPVVANSNAACVLVNHLTTAVGIMGGDPLQDGGGKAIRYYATLRLDFRKISVADSDPINKDEGMKVACYVRKNRCVFDRNPYVKCEFFIVYGEGTEQALETLQVAIDKGIIIKSGAWFREEDPATGDPKVLPNGDILKWQGKAAYKEYCLTHPDYFNDLQFRCGDNIESLSQEEIAKIEEEEKITEEEISELEKAIKEEEKKSKKNKKSEK